jgi:hypothetical protein
MNLPMLTEEEWTDVSSHFGDNIGQIKRYREKHQCSLAEAQQKGFGHKALARYAHITGFKETNANALYHHRLSMYGPACHACGKPLRTPRAKGCAACGATRANAAGEGLPG